KGGRNQAFIALAGALARAGWALEDAVALNAAVYRALWGASADLMAARAEVAATYEKHRGGFETTGRSSLEDLIDKRAVQKAFSWLGITQDSSPLRDEDVPPLQRLPSTQRPTFVLPKSETMEDLLVNDSICIAELMIDGLLPKRGLLLLGGRPKDG